MILCQSARGRSSLSGLVDSNPDYFSVLDRDYVSVCVCTHLRLFFFFNSIWNQETHGIWGEFHVDTVVLKL